MPTVKLGSWRELSGELGSKVWGLKDSDKPWLSPLGSDSCQPLVSALRISQPLRFQSQSSPKGHGTNKRPCNTTSLCHPREACRPATVESYTPKANTQPSSTSSFSASSPRSNPTSPNGVSGLKMACNTAWSFRVPMVLNSKSTKVTQDKREKEGVGVEPHSQLIGRLFEDCPPWMSFILLANSTRLPWG